MFHCYIIILFLAHKKLSVSWEICLFWSHLCIKSNISCFICACFQTVLWQTSRDVCDFISNFFPAKSSVASAVFLNCSFLRSFKCIREEFLTLSRSFWVYLVLTFCSYFMQNTKIHNLKSDSDLSIYVIL